MSGKERLALATRLQRPDRPQAIRRDVEQIVRTGMAAPGFILSTACSIAPGVPEEHVRIVAEVAQDIGEYVH